MASRFSYFRPLSRRAFLAAGGGLLSGSDAMPVMIGTRGAAVRRAGAGGGSPALAVGAKLASLGHSFEQFAESAATTNTANPQIVTQLRSPGYWISQINAR